MDYAEEQENELMMLESMYMEDFVKLDEEEAFEITIVPETGGDHNHVAAALKVKYSPTYPETPPVLHVRRVKGINEEQVAELEELVRREAENEDLLGSAMVYMLAEKMQEWLQENNEPEMADMHSQMMKRQQAAAASAAEAAQGGEEEEKEEAQSQSSGRLRGRSKGPAGPEGSWRASTADSAFHVGVTLVTAETFAAWRAEYDAEQAALVAAPVVGKKASGYVDERCRRTGRQIFDEVDLSTLTFEGEEQEEEGEEDLMLQREADPGGMVREEVAVAAAGEAGLLEEVGDEALFDEDEDIPDE